MASVSLVARQDLPAVNICSPVATMNIELVQGSVASQTPSMFYRDRTFWNLERSVAALTPGAASHAYGVENIVHLDTRSYYAREE